jgi:hypothetical protein
VRPSSRPAADRRSRCRPGFLRLVWSGLPRGPPRWRCGLCAGIALRLLLLLLPVSAFVFCAASAIIANVRGSGGGDGWCVW